MERARITGRVTAGASWRWPLRCPGIGTWGATVVVLAAVLPLGGCSLDSLLKSDQLPPNVTDPAVTQTHAGALAVYQGSILQLATAFGGAASGTLAPGGGGSLYGSFVAVTGMLSDELDQSSASLGGTDPVNQRALFAATDPHSNGTYSELQRIRGQAGQAIGLLTQYAPDLPAAAGHMYALEAYAEIMLGELFCSGIPLSTIDYAGDYTYRAGSTTDAVFAHAVALLDTAVTLAADSARFVDLIRVAQGRALLNRGQYAAAAAAVAAVPDGYSYTTKYSTNPSNQQQNFASAWAGWGSQGPAFIEADQEGINGLDFVSSEDPRTAATLVAGTPDGVTAYRPNKYATDGGSPIVLASGVEARLIQAEAALQAGDPAWLTMLNALRTDGTYDLQPTADPTDDPAAMDTLWHAGTGGVAGLKPLADPGASLTGTAADSARIDLVFRERAFWLYLTGHRQGDLRRLIRQYGRTQSAVYPIGPYPVQGNLYGIDVVAPIPVTEKISNPLFTGCASTGA